MLDGPCRLFCFGKSLTCTHKPSFHLDASFLKLVVLLNWGTIFRMVFYALGGVWRTCTAASQPWEDPQKMSFQNGRHNFSIEQWKKVNPTLSKINKWGRKMQWLWWMVETGSEYLWNVHCWRYWKHSFPRPSETCLTVEITPALLRDWTRWPHEAHASQVILWF